MKPGRTLKPDDRLSHYRIVGPLGVGGMGEVYLAQDQTLERNVALKILPPGLVRSEERVRRFMLEAKSASSLNHPNIVTIFEIGEGRVRSVDGSGDSTESSSVHFISMELISGKTLSTLIHDERTDLRTLLGYLAQAAEGLSKAHAAGIVHRDLKPGNIMVSNDGYAKVLDFGLAKLIEKRQADPALSSAPTETHDVTSEGVVLGTAGYMSPEQVQGKPLDHRSDIFSMGCILYEATTRQRPFLAESDVEVMHAILHEKPAPVEELNPKAPAELRRLIRRSFAKAPDQRLHSMKDLAIELREIVEEYDTLSASASSGSGAEGLLARRGTLRRIALPLTMVAGISLLGWLVWKRPWQSESPAVGPPEWKQLTFSGKAEVGEISPDGNTIAFVAREEDGSLRAMVQDVSGGEAITVFRSEDFLEVQWPAAGNDIVVTAAAPEDSVARPWLVPRMGGQPRALPGGYVRTRLSPDGGFLAQFVLGWRRVLIRRLSDGDTTWIPLEPRFTWLEGAEWSPDGKMLLFEVSDEAHASVWTMRSDGRRQQKVHESIGRLSARWAPGGDAIYCVQRSGAQRIELVKVYLRPDGGAARRQARVLVSEPTLSTRAFGVSADGRRIVCTRGTLQSNLWLWNLARGDRQAAAPPRQLTQGAAFIQSPVLSPKGERVAYRSDEGGAGNVHVLSLVDGSSRQLTFFERGAGRAVWSPDGRTLAFTAYDADTLRVWRVSAVGGPATVFRRTSASPANDELAWWPGSRILYALPGNRNFNVLDPETEAERSLVANDSVGWMFSPAWSPDGKHVAVVWNRSEAGTWVVSTTDTSQIWLTSIGSFFAHKWSGDGSALLLAEESPPRITRVGFPRGDTTTVLRIPSESVLDVDFTPDLERVVYVEGETNTDVWLLENFDPEVRHVPLQALHR
jgi:serine/threonine protein kinase/Tol biopolymer transport system component